ncbi:MAG: fibrobacter succinogenes major paralogous domain-containing protein [Saprospiraceae bacterium]|nr:fibrobacter succinogenes major paralogous domain-containing protein [Saprospiraceae bacterium]
MISLSLRSQLLICFLILSFESALSQTVMRVHRNDGSVVEIPTEDIRTVKYTTLDYDLLSRFSEMEVRHVKSTSAHIHFNVSTKTTERNYVKTIKIGNQIWTADNLDTKFFKNGDAIPIAKDVKAWEKAQIEEQPVMLYMNFDENKKSKYGAYYNYFAIRDKRGLCPPGFRLPDINDCEALYDHLKTDQGTAIKSKLGWVDITDWDEGRPGDNRSGFSALPSGFYSGVGFHDEGYSTVFPIFPVLYKFRNDFYGDLSWKGVCVRCIHESF